MYSLGYSNELFSFNRNLNFRPPVFPLATIRTNEHNPYTSLIHPASKTLGLNAILWKVLSCHSNGKKLELPCRSVGKESACNARDLGSITGLGRAPGEGNGKLLQYPCSSGESHGQRSLAWATAHGLTRVGHDLTTKPPPVEVNENFSFWNGMVAC